MKTLLLFVALCCCTNLYAQDTATTTKGVKILVYSDGTWRPFDNAFPAYTHPVTSTSTTDFLDGKARLWFNDSLWALKDDESKNENGVAVATIKYSHLQAAKGESTIIVFNIALSESMIQEVLIPKILATKNGKKTTLLKDEMRLVNGLPMHYYECASEDEGIPVRAIMLIYTGKLGTVIIGASIAEKEHKLYRRDIEDFIYGMEIQP